MATQRKRVALIGCGEERYRRYLLEQLADGYDILLLVDQEPSWQRRFVSDVTQVADFRPETLETAIADARRRQPIDGVVCWDERYVIAASDAAVLFELASAGSLGIRGCRDKALSRSRLDAAGIRQPRSRYCLTADEAAEFAGTLRYPVVVKPRGMGGSIGVSLVGTEDVLRARFAEASRASLQGAAEFHNGAIVEEYVNGPEISVDGIIVDGGYKPLFVARKTVGLAPFFEELGHVVSHDDILLHDAGLRDTLGAAHRAIAFENGITHTELKLTPEGFVIIEINGRLGGDLIPFLASLAIGVEPGLVAGQVACRDPVLPTRVPQRRNAAIWFRYPDASVTVAQIELPRPVERDGMHAYCVDLARPGARLGLPPDAHLARAGYAIATGDDPDACLTLCRTLSQEIRIEVSRTELAMSGD